MINNAGLLLGDDVGLGKTILRRGRADHGGAAPAAIIVSHTSRGSGRRSSPSSTTLRLHTVKGTQALRSADRRRVRLPLLERRRWIDVLDQGLFKTVVYDEVQELRHGPSTSKGQACRR